jgi:DNA-binding response OmpR family regulator
MFRARRLDEWSAESHRVRRTRQNLTPNVYERGYLQIDFDAYQVWVDGRSVHLTRREFQLLRFFVQSANRVFDRTQILAHVWPRVRINPRTVDVHVYRLRHSLERDPEHPELFVTVRGVGWRFDERTLREARGTVEAQHADPHVRRRSDRSC